MTSTASQSSSFRPRSWAATNPSRLSFRSASADRIPYLPSRRSSCTETAPQRSPARSRSPRSSATCASATTTLMVVGTACTSSELIARAARPYRSASSRSPRRKASQRLSVWRRTSVHFQWSSAARSRLDPARSPHRRAGPLSAPVGRGGWRSASRWRRKRPLDVALRLLEQRTREVVLVVCGSPIGEARLGRRRAARVIELDEEAKALLVGRVGHIPSRAPGGRRRRGCAGLALEEAEGRLSRVRGGRLMRCTPSAGAIGPHIASSADASSSPTRRSALGAPVEGGAKIFALGEHDRGVERLVRRPRSDAPRGR